MTKFYNGSVALWDRIRHEKITEVIWSSKTLEEICKTQDVMTKNWPDGQQILTLLPRNDLEEEDEQAL